jgi:CysZ protein
MTEVLLALRRSLATLGRGRVWGYILAPALIALLAVIGLSLFLLERLIETLLGQPPIEWIAGWGALWLAKLLAVLGGWLLILSASYLIATLLTAILVLPLLLGHLAATDYADVDRRGSDSVLASTWNSVWAAVLFVAGWIVSLPLWLIPGLALLLPFFWMAWLNRRTFAYDCLAAHASPAEWGELRRRQALPLLGLGLVLALLAHLPIVGMLAPSLAALAYVHYCLEALRRLRQGAIVQAPASTSATQGPNAS